MSEPEVIKITVKSWKRGDEYTCRACGKGTFLADTSLQGCPECGQKHEVWVQ